MRTLFHFLILVLICAAPYPTPGQSLRPVKVNKVSTGPWVKPQEFDPNAVPISGQESSFYYLLIDEQENIAKQETYTHYVYKILTNEGIQDMSDLSIDFDPSYEKLLFHTARIHRNGQLIDQLPEQVATIQREQSMDRYLYDGSLTALINLSDVRIGDVVEYSFTRIGYNPVYEGNLSRKARLNFRVSFERSYYRILAPTRTQLYLKYVNTESKPVVVSEGDVTEYSWKQNRVKGVISDKNEPEWYDPYSYVQITSLKDWSEIAAWSAKRFQVGDRDMQRVMNEIYPQFKMEKAEDYALRVIRFVQDEIRYLGFESGINSHKPHPPGMVYTQRFGDCKDKSLLLATLLEAGGITAHPVLVNTSYRTKISEWLPSVNAFDHCVVQFSLNNQMFYVDPTINNQGGDIDNFYFPPYGKGLVVSKGSNGLIDLPNPGSSSVSEAQTFDIASIGGESMFTVTTTYTGGDADDQRSYFAGNNVETIQKNYLNYYANIYPDIQVSEKITTTDNRAAGRFVVTEKYKITTFWKPYPGHESKIFCEFYPQTLEGYFNVSKSTSRTAPYRLQFPVNHSHEITINLPEAWSVTPDHEEIETDYYKYAYNATYEDKRIVLSAHYKTKQSSIPVSNFATFVEDHGKMMANLSYSLTYDPSLVKPADTGEWPGLVVSIIGLGIGVWLALWLYHSYDPQPYYPSAWGQPIGGWLILVAIGVSAGPFVLIYSFYTDDFILNGEGWLAMWYSENYLYCVILFLLHLYNVAYLLFSILILVLFYQRRSSLPFLISVYYGSACLIAIFDSLFALQIDPAASVDTRNIMRSIVSASIWIPYFQLSQRVKKTFVTTHKVDAREQELANDAIHSK